MNSYVSGPKPASSIERPSAKPGGQILFTAATSLTCAALLAALALLAAPALAAHVISTWDGTTNNWTSSANWSPSAFFPNNGNGGNTYDAVINGGMVTLDQAIRIEKLTLNGGEIAGSSNLNLNGLFTWSNGTMSGTGVTTIEPSGSLELSGSNFANHFLNRTLVNNGTATWISRPLSMSGGSIQNNGTFNINATSVLIGSGGVFNNAGTLNKLGTQRVQFINTNLTNSGNVNVQAGELELPSGFNSHTGEFSIASVRHADVCRNSHLCSDIADHRAWIAPF